MKANNHEWNFEKLVGTIRHMHEELAAQAGKAVNISLTLRNWLFGCYIAEYELNGLDRANYGDRLLTELAKYLTELKISNCNRRQLYRYLRFYRLYPEIVRTLSPQLKKLLPAGLKAIEKVGTAPPQLRISSDKILHRLSYSHLELIVDLDGILLCTQRDRTLVEYALAGMDNGLFVSKYQLELPKKEDMQRFIEEQIRETES
jgi:hypothetical protein